MQTKVIFRKFKSYDKGIIALFPELPGNINPYETCESYMHIGQHGAASVDLVRSTLPAYYREYLSLMQELESLGYDLRVCERFTHGDLQKRIKATRV